MNALFHAINIGTLATWLSVTGFGTVAGVFNHRPLAVAKPTLLDALPVSQEVILGDETPPEESPQENSDFSASTLSAPPELPSLTEFEPLPEIPDLPAPKPAESSAPAPTVLKPSPRPAVTAKPKVNPTGSRSGTGAIKATAPSRGSGGSGMSASARLAAGRMTPPSYPPFSRRNGQTGTVLVEFTVDASGRVISAYAKSSSKWPLLDNEAVKTVRSWKFPAGGVMKLQRPIVFRLN